MFAASLVIIVSGCASHPKQSPDAESTRTAADATTRAIDGSTATVPSAAATSETFEPVRVAPTLAANAQGAGTEVRQIVKTGDESKPLPTTSSAAASAASPSAPLGGTVTSNSSATNTQSNGTTTSPATVTETTPASRSTTPNSPANVVPSSNSPNVSITATTTNSTDAGLARLVELMCGEFNSAAQAAADPDYRDISLKIARIWPGHSDGHWLYVEQAVTTMLDRPARQRIYHVTSVPNTKVPTYRSEVFTLPGDARRFVGAWKDVSRFKDVAPSALEVRTGCAVMLTMAGPDRFTGSTVDRNCQSEFQKASYATSEVTITPSGMVSWDRGFDNDGKQVWGATGGGYKFDRLGTPVRPVAVPEK